jgi:hypothetical protein
MGFNHVVERDEHSIRKDSVATLMSAVPNNLPGVGSTYEPGANASFRYPFGTTIGGVGNV